MTSMLLLTATIGSLAVGVAASDSHHVIIKSLLANGDALLDRQEGFHRILSTVREQQAEVRFSPTFLHASDRNHDHHGRHLDDENNQEACDASFIKCIPDAKCIDCFATLEMEKIDWTGVPPGTPCTDVVKFLTDGGHCKSLKDDDVATSLFCQTFDACVIWNDPGTSEDDDFIPDDWVNCTALTKCEWEGMHRSWIGDGVCHDNMHGCYNTEICGYDGGDCCEDTCTITEKSSYMNCGHDGYACRDPKAAKCDSRLTRKCPSISPDNKKPDPSSVECEGDTTKYRLIMYDSFGDGWDTTTLTIKAEGGDLDIPFKGGLPDGFQGTEYICLSKTAQCYNVKADGGTWGVEVSWEIRPMGEGAPSIAGGGSPGDCDFSVAGEVCPKTCDGSKPNVDPSNDPDYNSFKDLYNCIEDKCIIQLGACNNDPSCKDCFAENAPDYCFGVDTFVAVIDCTMCSCTDKKGGEFCNNKEGPGAVIPSGPDDGDDSTPKDCTPKETMAGASAIMDFSRCSDLDEVGILITEFDQNNFGMLDSFETCAHSFRDDANHGGHTALGCMKILKNAVTNPIVDGNKNAPKEAISALAKNLYDHGGTFCDCAKKASDGCPLCPNFMSFKTILYESLDACQSLDAIDCDAWNEFWKPCQDNLAAKFALSDFSSKDQCEYAKNDCGGAGTFPAFRRLDCEGEIPVEAWSFYKLFSKKCLKGADGVPPGDTPTPVPPSDGPVPSPTNAPKPSGGGGGEKPSAGPKPTPKPYVPSDGGSKPYVPAGDSGSSQKKSSHWFRNLLIIVALGGIGYYIYKKRFDGFNFVQYRRRVFGSRFGGGGFDYGMVSTTGFGGESEMYSNLNSSTTFEPPSLPPTPQMMGGPSMMGSVGQFMGGPQMT